MQRNFRLASAERDFQAALLLHPCPEKPAIDRTERAPAPIPTRLKPFMQSTAHPIQNRSRPGPRHTFAAVPGGGSVDREYALPSLPSLNRLTKSESDSIAA